MKHLKSFENFDLGRFSDEDDYNFDEISEVEDDQTDLHQDDLEELDDLEEEEQEEEDLENRTRVWGDEIVENKKLNK
jgi:hypothetical protein